MPSIIITLLFNLFKKQIDKIYLSTPTKIAILDHEKKRTFVVRKDGLADAGKNPKPLSFIRIQVRYKKKKLESFDNTIMFQWCGILGIRNQRRSLTWEMRTISICFVLKLRLSKDPSHWNPVKSGKEDSNSLRFLLVTPVDSLTPGKSSSESFQLQKFISLSLSLSYLIAGNFSLLFYHLYSSSTLLCVSNFKTLQIYLIQKVCISLDFFFLF